MGRMKLFGKPGWGSVLIEAQLEWYGYEYDFDEVGDLFKSEESRRRLAEFNPLAQIPTLVLEDGTVITESAAITLHLADLAGDGSLVPASGSRDRVRFLRWLVFIVANIYPTYTYGDDPSRFVPEAEAQKDFQNAVNQYAQKLYSILELEAGEPWFLGESFSALDIYVCAMTRWRPGRGWFAENAPKLFAIAGRTETLPALEGVWQRNLPGG
jgi:GST-like protein